MGQPRSVDVELNDFFESKEDTYVKDGDISIQENLLDMLLSKSEESIELGLEMITKGAVPKEYITPLFCIFKNSKLSQKIRKLAKSFLELHTDDLFKKMLSSRKIIFTDYIDQNKLYKNLCSYIHDDLDKKVLAKYVVDWTGHGYMFWFAQLSGEELDATINQLLRDNPSFVLSESYFYYAKKELTAYSQASRIAFTATYRKDLPNELRNFKNLTFLNLSNTGYKRLPDWFPELKNLKELHWASARAKEFPSVLTKMEQLKEIHIYNAAFADNVENIPDCFDTSDFPYSLSII